MAKKPFRLYQDRGYLDNRLTEIQAFCDTPESEGLDYSTIAGLFEYLLAAQHTDGSWLDPDGKWTAVQTAVVLKALSRLGYTSNSNWPILTGSAKDRGGVQKGLDFFKQADVRVHPNDIPNTFAADIWDTCQVLLALMAYGQLEHYHQVVEYTKVNWRTLWEKYMSDEEVGWRGIGFLAAILDVLMASDLTGQSTKEVVDYFVQSLGSCDQQRLVSASEDWKPEPCWHIGLTLRTLARVPELLLSRTHKTEMLQQLVTLLLSERGKDVQGHDHPYWGVNSMERWRPMFTSRALEGLNATLPHVHEDIAMEITCAVNAGNQYLFSHAEKATIPDTAGIRIGSLKSTTCVAEYFASLVTSVPIAMLIDTRECLARQIEVNDTRHRNRGGFDSVEGLEKGLRIAWLSDLHIADMKRYRNLFALKRSRLFRSLFLEKKNVWTEKFASENLDHILKRIREKEFNHVIVTGDVTNLATDEQFRLARDKFLSLQASVGIDAPAGTLSPDFWTILPGNHDVSGYADAKLSLFFSAFGDTYGSPISSDPFPFRKTLDSPAEDSELKLGIIGMDSTPRRPVQVVGMNARGYLGREQKDRLSEMLTSQRASYEMTIVALHHAPLVTPFLKSNILEYFMSLDENDANDLIALCCTYGIKAILHGHFHTYSPWHAPVGTPYEIRGYMPIIGSPCGTVGAPGEGVEFIELREVQVRKDAALMPGLSLYQHKLLKGTWEERDLETTIL